jgi:transposase
MSEDLAAIDPECPGCRALLERLLRLTQELDAVSARVAELDRLQARVGELEQQLGRNSTNSHQPPSTDKPDVERPKRAGSKRKRGGQKGHKRNLRELLPPDKVDALHALTPSHCHDCGTSLEGRDPNPVRHQVTELPLIAPEVTEYQLHALSCTCCGKVTRAALPAGVPTGAFGPRLAALVATLTAHHRLSKGKTRELLGDVLGIQISTGALSNLEGQVAAALAAPVEEARQYVQAQEVLYLDETGWREQGHRAWLWTVVSRLVVVFVIRGSRGSRVAKELLGANFDGTAVTDRYSGYSWIDRLLHQLCWAHLIRDFQKMAQVSDTEAAAIGDALLGHAKVLFAYWERLKSGTLRRSSFRTYASALRQAVHQTLVRGAALDHQKVAGMCRALLRVEAAMWTFVRIEGVEPTNNDAEREVRHGVLYRKISFGTQSERGSRFVERMLSVRASLRRQGRNVFQFLVDAVTALNHGIPPPSLLPITQTPA